MINNDVTYQFDSHTQYYVVTFGKLSFGCPWDLAEILAFNMHVLPNCSNAVRLGLLENKHTLLALSRCCHRANLFRPATGTALGSRSQLRSLKAHKCNFHGAGRKTSLCRAYSSLNGAQVIDCIYLDIYRCDLGRTSSPIRRAYKISYAE